MDFAPTMTDVNVEPDVVGNRDSKDVCEWRLGSEELEVTLLSFGATITSIKAKDRSGKKEEVTLCHRRYAELSADANRGPYFGCVAGRVANRIARGKFSLNDTDYSLAINNGKNTNHGGAEGFDRKVFDSRKIENGVEFTYISPSGEEGFPGSVELVVTYTIDASSATLQIGYEAKLSPGEALSTPINLTNHTYFNLSGDCRRKVTDGHALKLSASHWTPVDDTQIPIGQVKSVEDTEFDYRKFVSLSERVPITDGAGKPGVDHNFVVDGALDDIADPAKTSLVCETLRHVAELKDDVSGRVLTVKSTQPGIQVYTANWLSEASSDAPFTQYNGVALESQHFPDSINKPAFPNTVLRPGETYSQRTVWQFSSLP